MCTVQTSSKQTWGYADPVEVIHVVSVRPAYAKSCCRLDSATCSRQGAGGDLDGPS